MQFLKGPWVLVLSFVFGLGLVLAIKSSEPPPLPAATTIATNPPVGLSAWVKLEPDPARIFTITWTNLPQAYTNGYRIESTQSLADGWSISGTSTSNVKAITFTTRTGPNTSFYRLSPLVGDGSSPVYILQWINGNPEIVVWDPPVPPDPDPDPDPDPPIEMVVVASDDVYLQSGVRLNDQFLKVEAGLRVAYLKFNITGITAPIVSAQLRLREAGDPGHGTFRAWRGSHDSWTETTITSNTAPGKAHAIGMFQGPIAPNQTITIDLGLNVSSNGVYSIVLEQDPWGGNDVWFGSKESTNQPVLQLLIAPPIH